MLRPVSIAMYGPRSRFHLPRAGSASAADRDCALTPDTQVPTSPTALRINAPRVAPDRGVSAAVACSGGRHRSHHPVGASPVGGTWLRLVGSPPDRRGSSGWPLVRQRL